MEQNSNDDRQVTGVSRRGFMVSTLAVGFALAVRPVLAETITTDTTGLNTGEVSIPTSDGNLPAFRAMRVPDAQVMADLDAAVAWAKASGDGDIEKLGIAGFCWGGRIVWLYAAHSRRLKAGVAWYGRLAGNLSELQPKHPVDVAGSLNAPVLGLYGGSDQGIPLDTVERMQASLKAANSPSHIVVYPDTPHAFFADYRPSYRKQQAEDGWNRLREWFTQHGVA
jgi:carboxymethylenebutenolidase